jgi:hypothetical protein
VGEFLEGVPPALAVAFRAQGLLRSVTLALGLPRPARMWRTLTARNDARCAACMLCWRCKRQLEPDAPRVCCLLQEATVGLEYRNGVAPSGAAAAARLQLRLAVVRVRFLARVVRLLLTHADKPCQPFLV